MRQDARASIAGGHLRVTAARASIASVSPPGNSRENQRKRSDPAYAYEQGARPAFDETATSSERPVQERDNGERNRERYANEYEGLVGTVHFLTHTTSFRFKMS